MLANYAPILIFLIIAGAISVVLLGLGFWWGSGRKDPEKLSAYECGFDAFELRPGEDPHEALAGFGVFSEAYQS